MSALTLRNNPTSLFSPLFADFVDDFFSEALDHPQTSQQTSLRREDDNLVFEVDAPGVKKEDVKIHLQEGRLSVQFSRGTRKYSRTEYVGDVSDAEAKLEDGVLTVKMRIPNAKKIEIKVK